MFGKIFPGILLCGLSFFVVTVSRCVHMNGGRLELCEKNCCGGISPDCSASCDGYACVSHRDCGNSLYKSCLCEHGQCTGCPLKSTVPTEPTTEPTTEPSNEEILFYPSSSNTSKVYIICGTIMLSGLVIAICLACYLIQHRRSCRRSDIRISEPQRHFPAERVEDVRRENIEHSRYLEIMLSLIIASKELPPYKTDEETSVAPPPYESEDERR